MKPYFRLIFAIISLASLVLAGCAGPAPVAKAQPKVEEEQQQRTAVVERHQEITEKSSSRLPSPEGLRPSALSRRERAAAPQAPRVRASEPNRPHAPTQIAASGPSSSAPAPG